MHGNEKKALLPFDYTHLYLCNVNSKYTNTAIRPKSINA